MASACWGSTLANGRKRYAVLGTAFHQLPQQRRDDEIFRALEHQVERASLLLVRQSGDSPARVDEVGENRLCPSIK